MVLKGIAKLITLINPDKWYRVSYIFTQHYSSFKSHPDKKLAKVNAAIKLDALLELLSATGKSFPIEFKINGLELFSKPRPRGLILCSAHMPLLPVALRALIENQIKLDAAILKPLHKDNLFSLFGTSSKVPVINNSPSVLLKAKTILQNGGIITALTDEDTGHNNFSPNLFRLAEKIKSDMIYFLSELKPEGHIEVSFYEAPVTYINGDNITRRVSALNDHRNRIFNIKQDFVIEKIC